MANREEKAAAALLALLKATYQAKQATPPPGSGAASLTWVDPAAFYNLLVLGKLVVPGSASMGFFEYGWSHTLAGGANFASLLGGVAGTVLKLEVGLEFSGAKSTHTLLLMTRFPDALLAAPPLPAPVPASTPAAPPPFLPPPPPFIPWRLALTLAYPSPTPPGPRPTPPTTPRVFGHLFGRPMPAPPWRSFNLLTASPAEQAAYESRMAAYDREMAIYEAERKLIAQGAAGAAASNAAWSAYDRELDAWSRRDASHRQWLAYQAAAPRPPPPPPPPPPAPIPHGARDPRRPPGGAPVVGAPFPQRVPLSWTRAGFAMVGVTYDVSAKLQLAAGAEVKGIPIIPEPAPPYGDGSVEVEPYGAEIGVSLGASIVHRVLHAATSQPLFRPHDTELVRYVGEFLPPLQSGSSKEEIDAYLKRDFPGFDLARTILSGHDSLVAYRKRLYMLVSTLQLDAATYAAQLNVVRNDPYKRALFATMDELLSALTSAGRLASDLCPGYVQPGPGASRAEEGLDFLLGPVPGAEGLDRHPKFQVVLDGFLADHALRARQGQLSPGLFGGADPWLSRCAEAWFNAAGRTQPPSTDLSAWRSRLQALPAGTRPAAVPATLAAALAAFERLTRFRRHVAASTDVKSASLDAAGDEWCPSRLDLVATDFGADVEAAAKVQALGGGVVDARVSASAGCQVATQSYILQTYLGQNVGRQPLLRTQIVDITYRSLSGQASAAFRIAGLVDKSAEAKVVVNRMFYWGLDAWWAAPSGAPPTASVQTALGSCLVRGLSVPYETLVLLASGTAAAETRKLATSLRVTEAQLTAFFQACDMNNLATAHRDQGSRRLGDAHHRSLLIEAAHDVVWSVSLVALTPGAELSPWVRGASQQPAVGYRVDRANLAEQRRVLDEEHRGSRLLSLRLRARSRDEVDNTSTLFKLGLEFYDIGKLSYELADVSRAGLESTLDFDNRAFASSPTAGQPAVLVPGVDPATCPLTLLYR